MAQYQVVHINPGAGTQAESRGVATRVDQLFVVSQDFQRAGMYLHVIADPGNYILPRFGIHVGAGDPDQAARKGLAIGEQVVIADSFQHQARRLNGRAVANIGNDFLLARGTKGGFGFHRAHGQGAHGTALRGRLGIVVGFGADGDRAGLRGNLRAPDSCLDGGCGNGGCRVNGNADE